MSMRHYFKTSSSQMNQTAQGYMDYKANYTKLRYNRYFIIATTRGQHSSKFHCKWFIHHVQFIFKHIATNQVITTDLTTIPNKTIATTTMKQFIFHIRFSIFFSRSFSSWLAYSLPSDPSSSSSTSLQLIMTIFLSISSSRYYFWNL